MILDMIQNCQETIIECVSFEKHFSQKGHFAVKHEILQLETTLEAQYDRNLKLLYGIHDMFKSHGADDKTVKKTLAEEATATISRIGQYENLEPRNHTGKVDLG